MSDPPEHALDHVRDYFTQCIERHGPSPRGVDWNTIDVQEMRFAQLMRVRDSEGPFSLVDWGCGYGALYDYLRARAIAFTYVGYDITPAVLEHARATHPSAPDAHFVSELADVPKADYVVASGVYNIKNTQTHEAWTTFAREQLQHMFERAERAIAVTFLTSYSDPPKQRPNLYYADPLAMFDFAKRSLSPHVAVLHDYGHWDFTLIVRKAAL